MEVEVEEGNCGNGVWWSQFDETRPAVEPQLTRKDPEDPKRCHGGRAARI